MAVSRNTIFMLAAAFVVVATMTLTAEAGEDPGINAADPTWYFVDLKYTSSTCDNSTLVTADSKYYKFSQIYPAMISHGSEAGIYLLPSALETCQQLTLPLTGTVYAKMTNECNYEIYSDASCNVLAPAAFQTGSPFQGVCEVDDDDESSAAVTHKRSYCTNVAPTSVASYTDLTAFNAILGAGLTPAATTAVAPTPKKDDDVCFTGEMTVALEDGSKKTMASVEVGDKILTLANEDLVFAEVVFIPHEDEGKTMHTFVEISADGQTLETSESHLIAAAAFDKERECKHLTPHTFNLEHKLIKAADVEEGMCVALVAKSTIAYAPVKKVSKGQRVTEMKSVITTYTGYPIVNGIAASSYALNNAVPDTFYNIHRTLYNLGMKGLLKSAPVKAVTHALGAIAVNVHQAIFF